MKVPAIAKKTFDQLRHAPKYMSIVQRVIEVLGLMPSSILRAKYVHQVVDEFNHETFAHPLIKQFSPCQKGCSACCHTQISVTQDEADLLAQRVVSGISINRDRLNQQAACGDSGREYFKLDYDSRSCVFLDESGGCRVYDDRPSVCRTNAVIGDSSQCLTDGAPKQMRLIKTPESDMAIYASFLFSNDGGALPSMLKKALDRLSDGNTDFAPVQASHELAKRNLEKN